MKTLILMRHAQAKPKTKGKQDQARPLRANGKQEATKMGCQLRQFAVLPQRILSSPARRARQTAKRVIKQLGFTPELLLLDELYLAEPQAYAEALRQMPDEIACAMIIGHNPGLKEFLQILTERVLRFPTTTVAYLDLPVDSWKEVTLKTRAELIELIYAER